MNQRNKHREGFMPSPFFVPFTFDFLAQKWYYNHAGGNRFPGGESPEGRVLDEVFEECVA